MNVKVSIMTKDIKVDLLKKTGHLFRRIWQEYEEYLMPESIQLSPHQMYFLNFLDQRKKLTPSEIADQLGITLGAVTGFMDRLYKLGLITRTRSEEDRRLVYIELSEEGKNQLQAFDEQRKMKHAKILEQFGPNEIEQLNQSLDRFRLVLDELREKK